MKTFIFMSFIFQLLITSKGCAQETKNYFDNSIDKSANTLTFKNDPSQTTDSIIVFDTGNIVTTTGQTIYEITTNAEKRMADSIREVAKKQKYPNPFSPPTLGFRCNFSEKTLFRVTIYDSLGYEFTKLFDKEMSPGDYLVKFAIFSVLKSGVYFLEIKYNEQKIIKKLIIADKVLD